VPLRVRVCRADEVVAGELRGFAVPGVTWPVIVTILDGTMIAFPGVCPHDDVSLVDYGVLDDGHVRCRVHGYRFDLATGHCEHMPALHLRRYLITREGDDVLVDLL
jgi:nitrite reductase/ring-hydroxylating ferredoxin subunit